MSQHTTDPTPTDESTPELTPDQVDLAEIRQANKPTMVATASGLGLPTTGTKAEVLRRIEAVVMGGHRRYVPCRTLCPLCRHRVRVVSTRPDYRRVRCNHCGYRGKA